MRIVFLLISLLLGNAPLALAQTTDPVVYASCSSRKYNNGYGEILIKIVRQKGDRYLVKSSKFLKKDTPLIIKGWYSEKDCKEIMLKQDEPLDVVAVKSKEVIVVTKLKLPLNRIYLVSQEESSQLFKYNYLAGHFASLTDEKKLKSSMSGFVLGTQIYKNTFFRLFFELQGNSWSSKLTSANKSLIFVGFNSCTSINDSLETTTKWDLCAKLLAGKSSDPNLHVMYSIAPKLKIDISRFWRVYAQVGLISVVSRSDDFPDNVFGTDFELGLAYKF